MLLVAPNQSLEGLDQSYVYMGSSLWNIPMEYHRVVWKNFIPIQPVLWVLSPLLSVLIEPPIPMSLGGLVFWSSTVDSVEL